MRLILSSILIAVFSILSYQNAWAQEPAERTFRSEPLKVILFPFESHSVEDLSALHNQLLNDLALGLNRAKDIVVLEKSAVEKSLAEIKKETPGESEALEIGKKLDADFVILGSLSKVGTVFSMDVKALNVASNSLFSLSYIEARNNNDLIDKLSLLKNNLEREVLAEALRIRKAFFVEKNLVSKLSVTGNRRVGTAAIKSKIKSKEEESFSGDQVKADIRAIYEMGFFSDVMVDIVDTVAGKEITFIVKERPSVKEISFVGNEELKEEKIREVVTIKINTLLDRTALKENVEYIRRLYTNNGFYLATVESQIELKEKDEVALRFIINEGDKVKVKRINFIGVTAFKEKELKKVMKTREKGFFSFITDSGLFEEDVFENDKNLILNKYFNNGYIQADIGTPNIQLSDNKKWLFITLHVEEGEQFTIGSIDFRGDVLESEEELKEKIESVEGKVFSRVVLMQDIADLADFYADQGYAFADVNPLTQIDRENKLVNLTLNIEKGKKVFVEKINISGNTKTRDKVIRREIELAEGDLFSSTKLKRSKRNLNRLGFFEVSDIATVQGSDADKIIFNVNVEEKPTGSFAVGAGYSSVDNLIGTVSIAQNNLFGTGRRLRADVTVSGTSQRYNISFTEPWFLDKPISAGFDLFKIEREYTDFTKFSTGGDIRFGFPVYEDTKLFLTYKIEQVDIKDVDATASTFIKEQAGERLESSISALLKRDTRNSILEPTEGMQESLSVEFGGGPLGGDVNFAKYIVDVGKYFPMPRDTTIFLGGTAGYVHSFGDDEEVPIFEKFFLGGINSIRGFESRSIGPKDPATGDVIGGDLSIVTNVEFIFPLVPKQRVRGLVFFDAGNAFDTTGDVDVADLRTAAGIGVRWLSPMGLLRLEWGFNLEPEDDEESSQFEFSLGGSF